ncbi:MAG: twin-arginine translocase TatA/TatE family subunit [Chloroflexota bacterium]
MLAGHLPELVIVLTLALIAFGPKRLPEIGSSLGQGIRSFRKGVSNLDGDRLVPAPIEPPQTWSDPPENRSA